MECRQTCRAIVLGLNQLRLARELCDVYLQVESVSLPAHGVVLAATSFVFKDLLMKDCANAKHVFKLCGIKPMDMLKVLDFLYTGQLNLTTVNMKTFKEIASKLNIPVLRDYCKLEESRKQLAATKRSETFMCRAISTQRSATIVKPFQGNVDGPQAVKKMPKLPKAVPSSRNQFEVLQAFRARAQNSGSYCLQKDLLDITGQKTAPTSSSSTSSAAGSQGFMPYNPRDDLSVCCQFQAQTDYDEDEELRRCREGGAQYSGSVDPSCCHSKVPPPASSFLSSQLSAASSTLIDNDVDVKTEIKQEFIDCDCDGDCCDPPRPVTTDNFRPASYYLEPQWTTEIKVENPARDEIQSSTFSGFTKSAAPVDSFCTHRCQSEAVSSVTQRVDFTPTIPDSPQKTLTEKREPVHTYSNNNNKMNYNSEVLLGAIIRPNAPQKPQSKESNNQNIIPLSRKFAKLDRNTVGSNTSQSPPKTAESGTNEKARIVSVTDMSYTCRKACDNDPDRSKTITESAAMETNNSVQPSTSNQSVETMDIGNVRSKCSVTNYNGQSCSPQKHLKQTLNQGRTNKSNRLRKKTCSTVSKDNRKVFKKCSHCDYNCSSLTAMRLHGFNKHDKLLEPGMKILQCSQCNFKTVYLHALAKHNLFKHRERKHKCTECSKRFHLKFLLKKHLLNHDPDHFKRYVVAKKTLRVN